MNGNQFPQGGAHLLGQPFTITSPLVLLFNTTMNCNCAIAHGGAPTELQIVASAPATCPLCQSTYVLSFQVEGKLGIAITRPEVKAAS